MLSPCSTEIMILIRLLRFIYVRYASGLVRDQGRLLHLLGEIKIFSFKIDKPVNTTPVLENYKYSTIRKLLILKMIF